MNAQERARLAKLCGRLESPHEGEVVAAARQITRTLHYHDLTWDDLIVREQRVGERSDVPRRATSGSSRNERGGDVPEPLITTRTGFVCLLLAVGTLVFLFHMDVSAPVRTLQLLLVGGLVAGSVFSVRPLLGIFALAIWVFAAAGTDAVSIEPTAWVGLLLVQFALLISTLRHPLPRTLLGAVAGLELLAAVGALTAGSEFLAVLVLALLGGVSLWRVIQGAQASFTST